MSNVIFISLNPFLHQDKPLPCKGTYYVLVQYHNNIKRKLGHDSAVLRQKLS